MWPIGQVTATLRDGGAAIGTRTITVTGGPCRFVSGTASPNPVGRSGGSGNLSNDLSISVTTSGVCSAISVSFQPGSASVTRSLTRTSPTATTWTTAIKKNDFNWTAGTKTFTVNGTSNGGSFTLQVN